MADELLTPKERRLAKDKGYKAFERDMQKQPLEQCIVDEYLKAQLAKVHKHRLERPELRGKIAIIISCLISSVGWESFHQEGKHKCYVLTDQILTLIPSEEEIGKQIEAHGDIYFNTGIAEGKVQERERIFEEIEEKGDVESGYGDAKTGDVVLIQMLESDWQALKEGA